jgi:hypothetical protein
LITKFAKVGFHIFQLAFGNRCRALTRTRQKGQAAIELLLIIPMFVALVLLTVDFGVWMYGYVSAANAAREGARWGAVNCGSSSCSSTALVDRVVERAGSFPIADTDVEVGWYDESSTPNGNDDAGDSVIVRINDTHQLLFWPGSVSIVACAQMRLESAVTGATLDTAVPC